MGDDVDQGARGRMQSGEGQYQPCSHSVTLMISILNKYGSINNLSLKVIYVHTRSCKYERNNNLTLGQIIMSPTFHRKERYSLEMDEKAS